MAETSGLSRTSVRNDWVPTPHKQPRYRHIADELRRRITAGAIPAGALIPEAAQNYDRKRAQGKRHNAALICLARRRCNVLFAMLQDHTFYEPRTVASLRRPLVAWHHL